MRVLRSHPGMVNSIGHLRPVAAAILRLPPAQASRLIAGMARRHRPDRRPTSRPTARPPERAPPPREPRREPATMPSAQPRRDTGSWIYGRHAVRAALRNPARRLRRLVAIPEIAAEAQAWLAEAKARSSPGLKVETLERARLEALLPEAAVHQGLALQAEP